LFGKYFDTAELCQAVISHLIAENAVDWSEAKPLKFGQDLGIVASSYNTENPMNLVFPDVEPEDIEAAKGIVNPAGQLRYSKKIFPTCSGLRGTNFFTRWGSGMIYFTEDVIIPVLEYRSYERWQPWMSLAPLEIWNMRSGIRAATKNVVIGGLGMGYFLQEVAKKHTVKRITVVEKDLDLIDWFGKRLVEAIDERHQHLSIELVRGDIWEFDFDKEDRILIDIWRQYGDARRDRRLRQLRSEGYRVWAWGSPRGSKYS
jgi:hypothetical protein